jgi:crotonobetainyl-CoA:carnitine CoA-transferase CaiB-like acyl-CoA transferase
MGALDGIRVIDFGQWVAGPLTAMLLADQGAEVIHVDPPGGPNRQTPANATLNRGKRCVTLDLKSAHDRTFARRLIESADILVENFRPGVMERLGLGSETLLRDHPRLIYCSLPGFAADDPRAGIPAWEGVVAAATGAYRAPAGADADQPVFTALHLPSVFGALAASTAIVMALIARERDGTGQRVEVPLFDAMFLAIGSNGLLVDGAPAGGRPDDAWSGRFACADGRLVQMNLPTPRFRLRFMETAGLHNWIARGYVDLATLARGTPAREHQQQGLRELFRTHTADEWWALGQKADVPLTPILTSAEWLQTAHAREAAVVVPVDDPELGPMVQPGVAVRLFGTPGTIRPRRPLDADRDNMSAERRNQPPITDHRSPATDHRPALAGLRVVDVTQVLAGPTAARSLAEFGADVVKINNPWEEGSGYRWNVHRYHTDVNRGKRTILVDLKTPEGLDIFWRLVAGADVVVQNFRPGVAERLGIGYEQVRARRPDIIYGTVAMFGSGGPWERLPGYEPNAQAISGIAARMSGPPFAIDDYATGLLGAFGIGLALFHRQRSGAGRAVEAALVRAATLLQTPYMQLYEGKTWDEPRGRESLGWNALQRLYRAADAWFFLGATASQLPSLAAVDGLGAIAGLKGTMLEPALEERLATKPAAEWVRQLTDAGIGAHVVTSVNELMMDPWVVAHGLSVTREHRDGSQITTIGPPARLSATPLQPGRPASPPGGDAEEVLAAIGMAEQLDTLVDRHAITLR